MSRIVRLRCGFPRFWRLFLLLGGVLALAASAGAAEEAAPAFGDDVQLAPFVVNGERLSISIHARTHWDRRYAEKFAEEVIVVAYESLGDRSTGAGLVIIGAKGEPHPVLVFRKFLAMAGAGQLDPEVAKTAPQLMSQMKEWEDVINDDEDKEAAKKEDGPSEISISYETMVEAIPLPLEGIGSKLYQLAWAEKFDVERVEHRLHALTVSELKHDKLFNYDWVFYLPPRNAFNKVLKEVIKQEMAEEKMGFFKRAAVRSALFVFKPVIKKAIEGMRKGMLFMTVMRARSGYSREDVFALTGAYVKVLMPDFKFNGDDEHRRALEAIEAQKIENAEYAKNPFVPPVRLTEFDPAEYAPFEGEYTREEGEGTYSFQRRGEAYVWQYKERKARVYHPAGDRLFVSANGKMTLEFQVDETGAVTGVEQRWKRHRRTFPRKR